MSRKPPGADGGAEDHYGGAGDREFRDDLHGHVRTDRELRISLLGHERAGRGFRGSPHG